MMAAAVYATATHPKSDARKHRLGPQALFKSLKDGYTATDPCARRDLPAMADSKWLLIAEEEFKNGSNQSKPSSSLINFTSPPAWRMQFRAQACERFFPTDGTLLLRFETAMKFLTMSAPRSPALAVILDGSNLIQLGQDDGNRRLLDAGRKMYCQSLNLLQSEISSAPVLNDGSIIGAIHVMQVCDMYTCMPFGDRSWGHHADGVATLLRSSNTIFDQPEFRSLLYGNFRMFSFWNGIIKRKNITHVLPPNTGPLENIAVKVPEMLELSDRLLQDLSTSTPEQCEEVLASLIETEKQLRQWSLMFHRNMRKPPFTLVKASSIPFVDSTEAVFPQILYFESFLSAGDHVLCTTCLLVIQQAILKVKAQTGARGKSSASNKTITDCADSLCMAIPSLFNPDFRAFGIYCTAGPLYVAMSWYRTQETTERIRQRLEWCEEAGNKIKSRGFRMIKEEESSD